MSLSEPEVTIYYLEMKSADALNAKEQPPGLDIHEAEIKQYQLNRFLYQLIGEQWQWHDKLSLSDSQWRAYAERETLKTYVATYKGTIAGYYELEQQDNGNTELVYFGLAPKFIGMGFGGYLLSHAITSAWAWQGTKRLWVHTCSLDHQSALQNYQARGFHLYRETTD